MVYLGVSLGIAGIARVVRVIRGGVGANRRTEAKQAIICGSADDGPLSLFGDLGPWESPNEKNNTTGVFVGPHFPTKAFTATALGALAPARNFGTKKLFLLVLPQ